MMLASASILLMLFGWMDVAVADADTSLHAGDSAHSGSPGVPSGRCRYGWSYEHHGDGHCCTNAPPNVTPSPKRTSPPAPRPTSRPATATVPHPPGSPPAHTSGPSTSPSAGASVEPDPPVIAPPALTVPPAGALTVGAPSTGPLDA